MYFYNVESSQGLQMSLDYLEISSNCGVLIMPKLNFLLNETVFMLETDGC